MKSEFSIVKLPATLFVVLLFNACSDRYADGYDAGYAAALQAVELNRARAEAATAQESRAVQARNRDSAITASSAVTTEVCGGDGVTVDGKYIAPGKTGCVRVYSDGRVKRY